MPTSYMGLELYFKGKGGGNRGHAGRPGKVGGSAPRGGAKPVAKPKPKGKPRGGAGTGKAAELPAGKIQEYLTNSGLLNSNKNVLEDEPVQHYGFPEGEGTKAFAMVSAVHKDLTARFPILSQTDPINQLILINSKDLTMDGLLGPFAKQKDMIETKGIMYSDGRMMLSAGTGGGWGDRAKPEVGGGATGRASAAELFRHEYGHNYCDSYTGQRAYREFEPIHAKLVKSSPDMLNKQISKYGVKPPREAFAESFRIYTHPGYTSGTLPKEIEAVFDKHVRDGNKVGKKKDIGLGLIFKAGVQGRSGNYGHTSKTRKGKKGGSDANKRKTKIATAAEKAINKVRDAKRSQALGMVPTKRLANGKLVLANGQPLPKHVTSGLTANIPPGWEDVYINPNARSVDNGAYAVRARAASGQTVGLYSAKHRGGQMEADHLKCAELEKKEPTITRELIRDLKSGNKLTRENAAVLRLIQVSAIRAGDEEGTVALEKAYGASNLEGRHVTKIANGARLDFIGKESIPNRIFVRDKVIASDLLARKNRAGNKGKLFGTDYNKVLRYTKKLDGGGFTPKNFRKLRATQWAIAKIATMKVPKTLKEYKASVKEVGSYVGRLLGHHSVKAAPHGEALKTYINPTVFSEWRGDKW